MALYNGFTTKFYGKCDGSNVNSGFALNNLNLIKQDLLNNLFTQRGERVMQPTFGTIIPQLLFEPLDETTVSSVEDEIVRIVQSDPRISLLNLIITPDYDNSKITVDLLLQYVELNVVAGMNFNIQFQ